MTGNGFLTISKQVKQHFHIISKSSSSSSSTSTSNNGVRPWVGSFGSQCSHRPAEFWEGVRDADFLPGDILEFALEVCGLPSAGRVSANYFYTNKVFLPSLFHWENKSETVCFKLKYKYFFSNVSFSIFQTQLVWCSFTADTNTAFHTTYNDP